MISDISPSLQRLLALTTKLEAANHITQVASARPISELASPTIPNSVTIRPLEELLSDLALSDETGGVPQAETGAPYRDAVLSCAPSPSRLSIPDFDPLKRITPSGSARTSI